MGAIHSITIGLYSNKKSRNIQDKLKLMVQILHLIRIVTINYIIAVIEEQIV